MPSSPTDRVYSDSHEWIMKDDNPAKMGITAYGASLIGTATAVTLPPKNKSVKKDDNIGTITNAQSQTTTISSLAAGTIPDRNDILSDGMATHPEYVTNNPYGLGSTGGWLVSIHITGDDPRTSMMTAEEYDAIYSPPS